MDNDLKELRLEIKALHRKLDQVIQQQQSRYVTASDILKLTGWTKQQLRYRRNNNLVQYRKNKSGGYEYNVTGIVALKAAV